MVVNTLPILHCIKHSRSFLFYWSRVRVVERTSLLKRQGVTALAGSNPAGSATNTRTSYEVRVFKICISNSLELEDDVFKNLSHPVYYPHMNSWFIRLWASSMHVRLVRMNAHPHEAQARIAQQIIANLHNTAYGNQYEIGRDSSLENYRTRIPIVNYEELYPYIEQTLKGDTDILLPGIVHTFAKSSGTTNARSKYIPLTHASLRDNHYRAGKSLYGEHIHTTDSTRIAQRLNLAISGSIGTHPEYPHVQTGDISAFLAKYLPWWAKHHRYPPYEIATLTDWNDKAAYIAKHAEGVPIVGLAGTPTWMAVILERISIHTGKSITDIFPHLEVFFHGAVSFVPYREKFKALITTAGMRYTEVYNASEGFFAFQDGTCRDGEMLLLLDHGIYYEFIEMQEPGVRSTTVRTLDEVLCGIEYALVISTHGGLYRYVVGDTIMFTSVSPYRITITGRTKHYINSFGEEVGVAQIEQALHDACVATNAYVGFFTVAPAFDATSTGTGHHEWVIAFDTEPTDMNLFTTTIDNTLRTLNSDYDAKRADDSILKTPHIRIVPRDVFITYLQQQNKLGGQHKIPPVLNNRTLVDALLGK